ncbi:MAG: efflux RND transporter periplasmic adaptor subunit [Phycisphaerae bacterium]|nr:efflux RND transporter periplasmic adaptor subunit [Phycisphaerae bacterium]
MSDKTKSLGGTLKAAAPKAGWLIVAFVLGLIVMRFSGGPGSAPNASDPHLPDQGAEAPKTIWTCSMHPQVRKDEPGLCPICNMDLIPLTSDDSDSALGPRQLSVSPNAAQLMNIETAPVERRFVSASVRMVGKVDYDETRLSYITAWIPGRLDRLYVDYTGLPVRKGDHMVWLYSPELISAQEELLQALKAVKNMENSSQSIMQDMTQSTVKASREKLRLWGLTPEQIQQIETTGEVSDHMTIYAPTSGIVIHKNAVDGMYVKEGTQIYTIADLSQVWVKLDAYESDLHWLRYGQAVTFTTISFPGETFTGMISFIDPILDQRTRTVKVRVNVPNTDGRLKPGMFIKAVAQAQIATNARILDVDLAGKWICPMHPEIVKDGPDNCDLCGMPLVQTESLGYVGTAPQDIDRPLVIPATAPLITGTRAIVYVQVPDVNRPTFEGREIVLGPRANDFYVVTSGLTEGELVVVRGNFKIDSSLQIQAKPSMMSMQPEAVPDREMISRGPVHPEFKTQLTGLFGPYFAMQAALANDDAAQAEVAARQAQAALSAVDMSLVTDDDHMAWMTAGRDLKKTLTKAADTQDIKAARELFHQLSQTLTSLARRFGVPADRPAYQFHCPMAFDNRGANWLQDSNDIANPYFGAMMLKCGSLVEVLKTEGED